MLRAKCYARTANRVDGKIAVTPVDLSCHIEVYNLGQMSLEEAVSRFSSSADFAWGTGWNSTATACDNGYSTPCRERPEKFFG